MIVAAFCGTGKSFLCDNFGYVEFECWKYQQSNFPDNYIVDIMSIMDKVDYVFISTNPVVLKKLHKDGVNIKLVYPQKKLKKEYFKRFIDRESSEDFMNTLDKYWHDWITELQQQKYCQHIILKSGQYLQDVIFNLK